MTIKLPIKDKEVELTMDEARQLHRELDELFGSRQSHYPSNPVPFPNAPNPYQQPSFPGSSYPPFYPSNPIGNPIGQYQGQYGTLA